MFAEGGTESLGAQVSHRASCCENGACARCADSNHADEVDMLARQCATMRDVEQLTNFALAAVPAVRAAAVRRLAELASEYIASKA